MGLSLPLAFLSSSGSRTNSSAVIRDFKSCWKTRSQTQSPNHSSSSPWKKKQQRQSESAQANAGESKRAQDQLHKNGISLSSSASSELRPHEGTSKTPKVLQATGKQNTFFLWHMDNLFSRWHLLKIHRTALFLQASSIEDVSPHVWNNGHTLYHLSRASPDCNDKAISHPK